MPVLIVSGDPPTYPRRILSRLRCRVENSRLCFTKPGKLRLLLSATIFGKRSAGHSHRAGLGRRQLEDSPSNGVGVKWSIEVFHRCVSTLFFVGYRLRSC